MNICNLINIIMDMKWRDDILIHSRWIPLNDDNCSWEKQKSCEFRWLTDRNLEIMQSILVDFVNFFVRHILKVCACLWSEFFIHLCFGALIFIHRKLWYSKWSYWNLSLSKWTMSLAKRWNTYKKTSTHKIIFAINLIMKNILIYCYASSLFIRKIIRV